MATSSDAAPEVCPPASLEGQSRDPDVCRERPPRPASYLGCCGLADDHPAWALLVLMGDGSVGRPLIQEALGRVDATVLDASFLFKLLTHPVTVMEIAAAGLICGQWTENREDRLIAVPWLLLPATAVERDRGTGRVPSTVSPSSRATMEYGSAFKGEGDATTWDGTDGHAGHYAKGHEAAMEDTHCLTPVITQTKQSNITQGGRRAVAGRARGQ